MAEVSEQAAIRAPRQRRQRFLGQHEFAVRLAVQPEHDRVTVLVLADPGKVPSVVRPRRRQLVSGTRRQSPRQAGRQVCFPDVEAATGPVRRIDDALAVRMPAGVLVMNAGVADAATFASHKIANSQRAAVVRCGQEKQRPTVGRPARPDKRSFVFLDKTSFATAVFQHPDVARKVHDDAAVGGHDIDRERSAFGQELVGGAIDECQQRPGGKNASSHNRH